jgi:uncharacterized protein (TIGR02599 family)
MNAHPFPLPLRKPPGFSLIELLVSVSVLSLIMVLVFQMLERTQATFKKARDSVAEFKDARNGFDTITRRLSQATLNTFWQVSNNESNVATKFDRESDLHFVCGPSAAVMGDTPPANGGQRTTHSLFFQAPTGYTEAISTAAGQTNTLKYGNFSNLLNAWGYFVEFGVDTMDRPPFLTSLANPPQPRARFRLMEYSQLTEGLQIYAEELRNKPTGQSYQTLNRWFLNNSKYGVNSPNNYRVVNAGDNQRTTRLVAENIIALIVLPAESLSKNFRDKLAPHYYYDTRAWQGANGGLAGGQINVEKSKHVLPPIVDVTMVAVDEADFRREVQSKNITTVSGFSSLNFTNNLFQDANDYDRDLEKLRQTLSNHVPEIKYRVFRASVRLREAKWGGFVDVPSGSN